MVEPDIQRVTILGKGKLGLHLARKVYDYARLVAILAKAHIGYRRVLGTPGALTCHLPSRSITRRSGPLSCMFL